MSNWRARLDRVGEAARRGLRVAGAVGRLERWRRAAAPASPNADPHEAPTPTSATRCSRHRRLLGVETEYAVAEAAAPDAARPARDELALALARTARSQVPSMGEFLANGGRLYVDGDYPEFATPECADPREVVRYIRAGDRILAAAASHPRLTRRFGPTLVFRGNVDYAGGSTWGGHESYLHRGVDESTMRHDLIPHLVSRVVFTGAGGFDPHSDGLRFSLSPRAAHFVNGVSRSARSGRGIFNSRNEPLAAWGYGRLHVICGDSLCSDRATWLKLGSTALVVALIEAGDAPGRHVQLADRVGALQTVAADEDCGARLRLADGGSASAVDIQREYLARCERRLGDPVMPDWAETLCRDWRVTLDRLARDPDEAATSLDWTIKRRMYARYGARQGMPSASWPLWTSTVGALSRALRAAGADNTPIASEAVVGRRSPVRDVVLRLTPRLREAGFDWDGLDRFLALRQRLFELDARFGQLGGGIFERLDARGLLRHRVDGVGDGAAAVERPPAEGRAGVRGRFVREHAGDLGFNVDWHEIVDTRNGCRLDLSDPLGARGSLETWR